MNIVLPENVEFIINELNAHGFKGYLVGGAVRDSFLNRKIEDYDIATDALPEDIQSIFPRNIPTGIKHGTVTVLVGDLQYEVTTFRTDGNYSDNRHPDTVSFVSDILEDLKRRDFTINAMAYNSQEGLIDPFNGITDIENRIVRCVGNPNDRYTEDALRMMRAVRFASQLKFIVDDDTLFAIFINRKLINNVSAERVRDELNKVVESDMPLAGMTMLAVTRILKEILPELHVCFGVDQNTTYHIANVGMHILIALQSVSNFFPDSGLAIRLAVLFHDIGKAETKTTVDGIDHFYDHQFVSHRMVGDIMKRLKYDNDLIHEVETLVVNHMDEITASKRVVKRFLNRLGHETLEKLIIVKAADIRGQNQKYFDKRMNVLNDVALIMNEILEEKEVFSLKNLNVNGHDLIELGFKEGPELGKVLNSLLEMVMDNPELNNREYLLDEARFILVDLQ
jgi:tRNA nucleotidyltransferase (CCA-adding enzyme)